MSEEDVLTQPELSQALLTCSATVRGGKPRMRLLDTVRMARLLHVI